MSEIIWAVYAHDVDKRRLLGHAIGKPKDIDAYFDERKSYGLEKEEVRPIRIPDGYADNKQRLIREKQRLENELKQINDAIQLSSKEKKGLKL